MNEQKWEKDGSSVEIRTQGELSDGRPALDEFLAAGAFIHLEQMGHDQWWMGVEAAGKSFRLWFVLRDGKLQVRLSDQGDESKEWEGDSREIQGKG
jgi:hypothetical protein